MKWMLITLICLGLCWLIPIKVQNNKIRQFLYYWVLIPISIVILIYCYPAGIEVFKNLALTF